ncbi:hypothetical protein [Rikenella microfusus]|uniref:hypothetical protein n=1 Tax=Rikenella microfusus TaxID=28139 RepID=UPI002357D356|nr:hypothetical protein [Rikenella microfusus]
MDPIRIHTKRLAGLERLKNAGLPVPDYRVVYAENDIPSLFGDRPAPYGWTIRTCKKNGENELGLFFSNELSKDEVIRQLSFRLHSFPNEYYIIYPSWDFYISFNIFKDQYEYIIEGKFGSQKDLSMGKETPSFYMKVDTLTKRNLYLTTEYGWDESVKKSINRAIGYIKKVAVFDDSRDYFEVAITRAKEIFFYEYWNIDEL